MEVEIHTLASLILKMLTVTITQVMPQPSSVVFDLLHDYGRRLEWDTLLCEARLTRGHQQAAKGATSMCVEKFFFGMIGIETEYLTFKQGSIAAVKMINRPLFFESFSASIRHADRIGGSTLVYKFQFSARPQILKWFLNPLMRAILRRETKRRLQSLSRFLEKQESPR
jgi:Polyketide cyclase / dehydrase and lipid transport